MWKYSMFYRIPSGRIWRIMADTNFYTYFINQFLQILFKDIMAGRIAATAIGKY